MLERIEVKKSLKLPFQTCVTNTQEKHSWSMTMNIYATIEIARAKG